MFNSLNGVIRGHDYPFVYLEIGGIEWALEVSATTFQSALDAESGSINRIYTYLHLREDALKLYGFWTKLERIAFLELISVSGIGPRQALKILSGTTVPSLRRYLEDEDVTALVRIPGLGKKTAQQLILQLKGHLVTDDSGDGATTTGPVTSQHEEIYNALVEMGYDSKQAEEVLRRVAEALDEDETLGPKERESELFRRSIVELSGR